MAIRISELTDAAVLTGAELLEASRPSATVVRTATTISAQGSDNSLNDSGNGLIAAGFVVGDSVRVQGFTGNVANNLHSGRITMLTAGKMTIGGTDGDAIVDDAAGESVTITRWETRRTPFLPPQAGHATHALLSDGAAVSWGPVSATTGTVTSVGAASGDSTINVSGSPVTSAGVIGLAVNQPVLNPNLFLPAQAGKTGESLITNGTVVSWGLAASSSANLFQYAFSTTTTPPPAAGQIRYNNATQLSATQIYVHKDAATPSIDLTNYYRKIRKGTIFWVQARADATQYQRWMVTAVSETAPYFTWTVSLLDSNGAAFGGGNALLIGYVFAAEDAVSADVTALTSSAGVVTVNCALGDYFTLALTENITSFVFTNLPGAGKGLSKWIEITQHASAAKTVVLTQFKWSGGIGSTAVSSALGAVDVLALTSVNNGTTVRATLAKAYA